MSLKEYTDGVLSIISECGETEALAFTRGLAERVQGDLGDLAWTAPEVAVARVGAVLLVAAALRLALAFVFPGHRWDICLMGGGFSSPSDCERGMAILFVLGSCLGLVPIAIWFSLVHPGFEKLTELQEVVGQNSFGGAELGYGSIMFITAYAAFVLLGSVVGYAMYGRMRGGEQAYDLIAASKVGSATKSIYFSSRYA